jgi:P4 family phage/plasmid primase-like protien
MAHDEWLRVGMGLHHQGQGGEAYLTAWIDWSAISDKFKEGECEARWASFAAQGDGIQAPVTLASLIKAAGVARMSQATASRKTIESRIDASSDFDELTKDILKTVFEASLPEADTDVLIKKISHKTKVSRKSLTQDGAQYRRVGASNQQKHLDAARAVLELLGKENLLFSQGGLWRWSEAGVWAPMKDREVKQLIHKIAANTKLTTNVINSIVDMVKTEVNRDNVVFDQRSDAINCLDGELQYLDWLGDWLLQPHVREHFRTAQVPLNYDTNAKAPRFEQFLDEVFAGDSDARQKRLVVEEALGYTLLASCRLEKFFMLIGGGANGKSVLLAVVAELVGAKQVSAVQPSQFDNRFQRGHLVGKLANIVTEIAQGAEIADDKLKSLVSGELTTAEMKFKDPFDFKPFATHWFGTNHLPRTRDFSDALFRRAILLSFNKRFEGDHRDVNLSQKLLAELPGIFNIALSGLARLL